MKVYNHEKPGLKVTASAAQLQLLITLLANNALVHPETAARLAGAATFSILENFSTNHIQEGIDEAVKNGQVEVTFEAIGESKEKHEAALAKAEADAKAIEAEKKAAEPAPAPLPFPAPAAPPKPETATPTGATSTPKPN